MISIPIAVLGMLALFVVNYFLLRAAFYEIYVMCTYSKRMRKARDHKRNMYIPKVTDPENEEDGLGAYDSDPDDENDGFEMVVVNRDELSGNNLHLDSSTQTNPSNLRRFLGIS
jgi:hypothetical protein